MNSIHSSKLAALVVVLALVAPGAVALSVDGDDPGDVEVGSDVDHTVTIQELHQNPQVEQWTLNASTDLEDAQWTLTYLDQAGEEIERTTHEGSEITSNELSTENNVNAVEVRVRGTVPQIQEYTYPDEEMVTVMALTQTPANDVTNDMTTIEAHRYTTQSQNARDALDSAQSAIESAEAQGANVQEARQRFDNAISAYEAEDFDNAVDLAGQAEDLAQSKVESSEQTQTILYAVGGLVVVLVIVGGFFWYRSRQDTYDKLG
jgi:hypothetical protein